jgi:hypothetical protein
MARMIVILADASDAQKRRVVRPIPLHKRLLGYKPRLCAERKLQSRYRWTTSVDSPLEMSRKVFRLIRLGRKGINQMHRRWSHIVVRVVEGDPCHDRWRPKLRRSEDDENRRKLSLN